MHFELLSAKKADHKVDCIIILNLLYQEAGLLVFSDYKSNAGLLRNFGKSG